MRAIKKFKKLVRFLLKQVAYKASPFQWKGFNEILYWKNKKKAEGELSNNHYKYFYTTHFGLDDSFYNNKVILDIGCGPRGSLEWASMASRRIGVDPLAKEYLKLGADKHEMEYINSGSESIPMNDSECDAVFSFNSLDHVEDVSKTLGEIKRITRENGIFLLLVEVNQPATNCEPHNLNPQELIEDLNPEFTCDNFNLYQPSENGLYQSISANKQFQSKDTKEIGWMSARFIRTSI